MHRMVFYHPGTSASEVMSWSVAFGCLLVIVVVGVLGKDKYCPVSTEASADYCSRTKAVMTGTSLTFGAYVFGDFFVGQK